MEILIGLGVVGAFVVLCIVLAVRDWHSREVTRAKLEGFAAGKQFADVAVAEEMAGNVLRYHEMRERFIKALTERQ